MLIRFGTGSYQHRSLPVSAQRMVNCYLEIAPPGSKSPVAVLSSYGIAPSMTVGELIRGGTVVNGVSYVVSGNGLYRAGVSSATLLGTIPGTGPVTLSGDGSNIVVCAHSTLYIYDGTAVTKVADEDFPGATWVGFLDGYFPIIEPNSGRIWVNETAYAPTGWNALDFATAEGVPDDLLWGIVSHREFYAFGRETIEVFYNSGNADFPLSRTASGFIQIGILGPGAAVAADNGIYFVGNDGLVYRLSGYSPERVSTHSVEQAIERYTDKTCSAMTWTEGGHKFVAFHFAAGSWVYDISTQLWHERASTGHTRWRPQIALAAHGRTYVGDYSSGAFGVLDPDTFTEWGGTLRASCTAPSIAEENDYVFHSKLELQFEQGVGTTTVTDPQVMLDWSDDGGRTWSSEHWRSLGAMGAYRSRAIWRRLGRSRDRVYRYAISDPVRRTLVQAIWQSE